MARNLEIKVACSESEFERISARAREAGQGMSDRLRQVDTYFTVPAGRLKLREIESRDGMTAELISYRRPDDLGSQWSDYRRVAIGTDLVEALKGALAVTCAVRAIVRKEREVVIHGRTRIHLDRLPNLGTFVELETVAGPTDSDAEIDAEHRAVIAWLGLDTLSLVAGSYEDLVSEDADVPRAAEAREESNA